MNVVSGEGQRLPLSPPLSPRAAFPFSLHMTKTYDLLRNELWLTGRGFMEAITGLAPRQWNFQPAPGRWSIRETAEHVTLVEQGVHRLVTSRLLLSPATPEQRAQLKDRDMVVAATLFDRSRRLEAPERVRPTGRWPEAGTFRELFEQARNATIAWIGSTDQDLRAYCFPHPILGLLDGKQWLFFIAAHTARHTKQILEIKAAPEWPAD